MASSWPRVLQAADAKIRALEAEVLELEEQSLALREEIEHGMLVLAGTDDPVTKTVTAEQIEVARRAKIETDATWSLKERELTYLRQLVAMMRQADGLASR